MSTVSNIGSVSRISSLIANPPKVSDLTDMTSTIRITELSEEQKAWLAQRQAKDNVREAEAAQRAADVEASNHQENHSITLDNISGLSIDTATALQGIVESMIENNEDAGMTVSGGYENTHIDSLDEYLDYLNKYIDMINGADDETTSPNVDATSPIDDAEETEASPTAEGADENWVDPAGLPGQDHVYLPNVASLSSEKAASVYQQVQYLTKSVDISNSVIHARNGEAGTYSIDTYMSWLAEQAGTDLVA